jgi:hypothetical protein
MKIHHHVHVLVTLALFLICLHQYIHVLYLYLFRSSGKRRRLIQRMVATLTSSYTRHFLRCVHQPIHFRMFVICIICMLVSSTTTLHTPARQKITFMIWNTNVTGFSKTRDNIDNASKMKMELLRPFTRHKKTPDQIRSHPHRTAAAEMTHVYTTEKKWI